MQIAIIQWSNMFNSVTIYDYNTIKSPKEIYSSAQRAVKRLDDLLISYAYRQYLNSAARIAMLR